MYQHQKKIKINEEKTRESFIIFVFLTLYFLSHLSGIYLYGGRANIKNKKERKKNINLHAPRPSWVMEQHRQKEEEGRRGQEKGDSWKRKKTLKECEVVKGG